MITKGNYYSKIKTVDQTTLPETLRKSHDLVEKVTQSGSSWKMYDSNETIKRTLDLYFQKLSDFIGKENPTPKTKVKSTPKKDKKSSFKPKSRGKIKQIAKPFNKFKSGSELITPEGKQIEVHSYKWDSEKKTYLYYASAADERNEVYYTESELKPVPAVKKIASGAKKVASIANKSAKSGNLKKVEGYEEDLKLMRRFYAFINKEKSYDQVLSLYKSLKRAITERRVNKQSTHGATVQEIQVKVTKLYNAMVKDNLKEARVVVTDAGFIEKIKSIIDEYTIFLSIRFIKRFITLEGAKPSIEKATKLLKDIEKAMEKGTISKSDKYLGEVRNIKLVLQNYISKKRATVELDPAHLNGLMGIAGIEEGFCAEKGNLEGNCGCPGEMNGSLSGPLSGVISAQDMAKREFEVMEFRGKWAALMGKPARNFDMMLHGEPGGGKTTLLLQFAAYLANHFGKVLYVSSEEFGSVTLSNKIKELLNPIPQNLHFAASLKDVDLSNYDFFILDSVNDLGLSLVEYKQLREAHQGAGFILILQHTKDGQFKGGKDWEHEVEIAGRVDAGIINIYKNRYGVKGELNFFN